MSRLKLWLLGSPRFERDGEPVELGRRKALALVIYLAVRRQAVSRDGLTALLWPEADQSRGRTALRRVLSDLNKVLGRSWLDVAGEQVALPSETDLWVDVAAFRLSLAACQTHGHALDVACAACVPLLAEAAALYRDDFLAGFTLPDCPAFDEWQFFEAESLRRELAGALSRLVRHFLAAGSHEDAIPYARRWLGLDPLMEAPHAALMQLYARTGQRAAALRQYQEYLHVLAAELGLAPDREMTALYERIRRGEEGPVAGRDVKAGREPPPSIPPFPALGAPLARPEDEIRLVSVLCASVSEAVDSGAGSSLDELAVAADMLTQLVKQAVSRYEARVDRFVGGSVQAVFGIPLAHEDDPDRAIRAALEIQAAARKKGLGVSVGISTGQVYFQAPGMEGQEATMIGPVVNLASRLQGKAPLGEVLVSEATYRHTRRAFEFALFETGLKGVAEPTAAYLVRRALLHPEKVRGVEGLHARLVGRDEELNRLRFALDAVLHGQGQIVSLIGEAGLGKSRLIAELKQVALAAQDYRAPLLWLESRCQELSMATSYWPFIDLLRAYFYLQADNERDRAGTLVTALQEMVSRGDLPAARLEEIGALLGNLLSLRLENDWGERLKNVGPAQIRRQTFLAIFDFLVALSRQRPLVLVFEDLHWADDLSLDLISLLMESIPSSPIILLCAYRPQPGHKSHHLATIALQKCPACYTELRLRELTPAQSYHLLQALLTVEDVPPAVQELVLNRSWGNPFFMEEIIRALADSGALYRADGQWVTTHVGAGGSAVPESIQSVILSRVDRLSPGLKRVLRCAAVIGWLFPMETLAEVVPADIDLEQALWTLEEAALIYRERVVPEVEYAFRHVLIQEAIYQTIARQQQAELHAQVAEVIERRYQDNLSEYYENLAYHYSRSANAAKAVEYLVKAGEKSRRAYFNEQAVDYFRQALDRLAELPRHAGLSGDALMRAQLTALTGLGQICYILGKGSEAEHYFRQAIGVGREARVEIRELVRLYFWLAEVLHWQGRYNEQARLGETVLALLAEDEAETVEAALVNQTIAIASIHRDDHARFYELTDRTARFIRRLPYSEELWAPYAHITFSLYERKRIAEMNRWLEVIQNLADEHNDLRILTIVYDHRGEYSFDRGDLPEASRNIGRALELYQTVGERVHIWRCLGGLVWIHLLQGDLATAEGYARRALESARTLGFDKFVAESYFNWGVVLLANRRWNAAVEAFDLAERLAAGGDLFWTQWAASYGLGCVYLAQGRAREARTQFLAALASFFPRPVPLGWAQHRWWSLLAVILSGLEAVCESAQAFEEVCRPFESLKAQRAVPPLPAQWQLIPVFEAVEPPLGGFADLFDGELLPGWTWRDPFGDGAFACRDGLEVRTPNGRDLWHLNRSAPCLLCPSSGDFTVQAVCVPVNDSLPSIGGLVLWKDDDNFLRLVWGSRGRDEVSFEGCISGQDVIAGRGRLAVGVLPQHHSSRQAILRLKRRGDRIMALCSADGAQWFGVGQVAFPVSSDVEVGLHAVGWIDRTQYPGAFPGGTAICFRAFEMWP